MSISRESTVSGAVPSFPLPGRALGRAGGARAGGGEVAGLRAALDAAVQEALRSFHAYVEAVTAAGGGAAAGGGVMPWVGAGGAMVRAAAKDAMEEPGASFPAGRMEVGDLPRAVMTPEQRKRLDEALALAFAEEAALVEAPERPAGGMAGFSPSPFAHVPAVVGREARAGDVGPMPGVVPASPEMMAAAPPLPGVVSPFRVVEGAAPVAPGGGSASVPPLVPPARPPRVVPAEKGASPSAPAAPSGIAEGGGTWPNSPFFGAAQAATAPFRMVDPPPVLASSGASAAGEAGATGAAGAEPGTGFNFAELLRNNGQR